MKSLPGRPVATRPARLSVARCPLRRGPNRRCAPSVRSTSPVVSILRAACRPLSACFPLQVARRPSRASSWFVANGMDHLAVDPMLRAQLRHPRAALLVLPREIVRDEDRPKRLALVDLAGQARMRSVGLARLSCTVRGVRNASSRRWQGQSPSAPHAACCNALLPAVRRTLSVACRFQCVTPFSAPAAAKRCLAWLLGTKMCCAHWPIGCVRSADSRPARPPQDARAIYVLPSYQQHLEHVNENRGTCYSPLQYVLFTITVRVIRHYSTCYSPLQYVSLAS